MKINFLPLSKLSLLILTLCAFSFTSCDDDDDLVTETDDGEAAVVFLSSNTSSQIGIVGVTESNLELVSIPSAAADADGIYYNEEDDKLFQVNRSASNIVAYENVDLDLDRDNLDRIDVDFSSPTNFSNGRGLAVSGDRFVVAQDGEDINQFVVYDRDREEFEFVGIFNSDVNLWGIQIVGDDMYAIADNSNQIAIYRDFFGNNDGDNLSADAMVSIEGLGRTHGLEYDETDDLLILTDIGEADDDSDGALFMIPNWSTMQNNMTITSDMYTRIGGDNTLLGNPVDVDYDPETDIIYVAERAQGGGRLLLFSGSASDDVAPIGNVPFAGASSLFFYRDR